MESLIAFNSSKDHYTADACIFWCFDARFAGLYNEFLKQRGLSHDKTDLVQGAGGAQPLAGEDGPDKAVAQSELAKSIKLHQTKRVILMVHMDCGGYGGSKTFDNDHQAEWDHHVGELKNAEVLVYAAFPEIKEVECWIADFDGAHRIEA